ncbi:MAG: hypothetical protein ACYSRZ_03885, partial [Planctomycetota bacterium]
MFSKRIKVLIVIMALLLLVLLLRLVEMQLVSNSFYRDKIAELKHQRSRSHQIKTLRGRILDRKARELATEELRFQLCINYSLTRFMDSRVRSIDKSDKFDERLDDLQGIIEKCTLFGADRRIIESRIKRINDRIWNLRTFLAWRRSAPDSRIIEKYDGNINSVPLSEALADFQEKFPSRRYRLELIKRVIDIADMQKDFPLLSLKTDDDVFTAQIEFLDVQGIKISPQIHRFYPHGSVAAHSIGWVGSHQQSDEQLFEDDKLASYLPGDVSGREDGAEYVCERILRGRRGEVVYDLDEKMINRAETTFGKDVSL